MYLFYITLVITYNSSIRILAEYLEETEMASDAPAKLEGLNDEQRRLLVYVSANPGKTSAEISKGLELPGRKVQGRLLSLKQKGLVRFEDKRIFPTLLPLAEQDKSEDEEEETEQPVADQDEERTFEIEYNDIDPEGVIKVRMPDGVRLRFPVSNYRKIVISW